MNCNKCDRKNYINNKLYCQLWATETSEHGSCGDYRHSCPVCGKEVIDTAHAIHECMPME